MGRMVYMGLRLLRDVGRDNWEAAPTSLDVDLSMPVAMIMMRNALRARCEFIGGAMDYCFASELGCAGQSVVLRHRRMGAEGREGVV